MAGPCCRESCRLAAQASARAMALGYHGQAGAVSCAASPVPAPWEPLLTPSDDPQHKGWQCSGCPLRISSWLQGGMEEGLLAVCCWLGSWQLWSGSLLAAVSPSTPQHTLRVLYSCTLVGLTPAHGNRDAVSGDAEIWDFGGVCPMGAPKGAHESHRSDQDSVGTYCSLCLVWAPL